MPNPITIFSAPVTPGSGQSIATHKDVDGNLYQLIILVDANGNSIESNGSGAMLVELASGIAGEDTTTDVIGVQEKPVVSGLYSPTLDQNLAAVSVKNLKISPGNIYSIYALNPTSTTLYFQAFNLTSAPNTGAIALYSWPIDTGTATIPGKLSLTKDFFAPSLWLSTGISYAISTTPTTYTAPSTNNAIVYVNYA